MFALIRLAAIGFVVLSIIYVALSLYSRAVRRRKLRAEWDETRPPMDRETFVDQGLKDYDTSLRRKLILGVYILPICVIGFIVYVTNFQ